MNGLEGNRMVSSRVGKHRDIISEAFDFMSCREFGRTIGRRG